MENGQEDRNAVRWLSCTGSLFAVRVPACKGIRVCSARVPDPQAGVAELLQKRPAFPEAARRGGDAFLQKDEAAAFVELTYKFDVLENGEIRIAAQFLEYGTPNEAAPVPETDPRCMQVREPTVKPKKGGIMVESESKGAPRQCGVG